MTPILKWPQEEVSIDAVQSAKRMFFRKIEYDESWASYYSGQGKFLYCLWDRTEWDHVNHWSMKRTQVNCLLYPDISVTYQKILCRTDQSPILIIKVKRMEWSKLLSDVDMDSLDLSIPWDASELSTTLYNYYNATYVSRAYSPSSRPIPDCL